jgi:hypothetical protein
MRQRALGSASPIKELEKLDQEFEQLLAAFSGPEFYSFDLDFVSLDRLASLCRHDLGPLFKLFDPSFEAKGRKPNFQPAPAKKALKELLDLYFILAGIQLSDGVQSNLFALLDRLERERSAAARERVRTVLVRLGKLLQQELAPELLVNLIRMIQEDPGSSPRAVSEETACLRPSGRSGGRLHMTGKACSGRSTKTPSAATEPSCSGRAAGGDRLPRRWPGSWFQNSSFAG